MRTRFLTVSLAAAVAVSGLTVPVASGQEQQAAPVELKNVDNAYIKQNFKNPYELPTAKPQDVILQVGASQDSVNLNWITAPNVDGQSVVIREASADASAAKQIDASSKTGPVYLTEAYKDKGLPLIHNDVANHKASVSDLKENTEYTYKVGSDKDGWSEEYTFNTGTYGDDWNFLFFGDVQLYSDKDLPGQTAEWDNTVTTATTKYPNTAFLLSGGDQANYSALSEHSAFISPEELRQYRTAVNNGNHDEVDFPTYQSFYNRPNVEEDGRNYWYTYNNALVVSLDTNHWKDYDDDVAFVRNVVKEQGAGKDWVIVTYHHATFSQAYHMQDTINQYYRERMTPIFSELDVDLVLSGHDHIYTRTYLMDGPTPVDYGRDVKSGETLKKNKGEVQYVTANSSSGSKYYNFYDFKAQKREEDDDKNPWNFENSVDEKTIRTYTAVWEQQKNPNYTNVDVTKDSLTVSTFDTKTGATVDAFTLTRSGADRPDAPKPQDPKPADPKPQDPKQDGSASSSDKNADKNKDDNGSSRNAGIAIGVIAAIAAVLGGIFFAAQQNLFAALNQFLPKM